MGGADTMTVLTTMGLHHEKFEVFAHFLISSILAYLSEVETEHIYVRACTNSVHKGYTKI